MKLFFQRLRNFFFADSWMSLFIQWLHSLPLPYWLTFTIIWILATTSMSLNRLIIAKDMQTPIVFFILSFVFSYELYILWHLENDSNALLKNPEIANVTDGKPSFLQILILLISVLLRILFLIYLVVVTVGVVASTNLADFLEILEIAVGVPVVLLLLYLILYLIFKVTKILSLIYKLRSQDISVNLFNLSPLYNLSQVTQKIALYLIPLSIAFLAANLAYLKGLYFQLTDNMAANITIGIMLTFGPALTLISGIVFILPVLWIRRRIVDVKSDFKSELGLKLQMVFEAQDKYAKEENFEKVKDLKEYENILISRKEYIERISEWPWETRVFREFSAAIFIPIVLSILQLYLTRWLGK